MDRPKVEKLLKVAATIPMLRNLSAGRKFWEFAGGFAAVAGCYYYFTGKATTPTAMVQQGASDMKSIVNTVASGANMAIDAVADGATSVIDTVSSVTPK